MYVCNFFYGGSFATAERRVLLTLLPPLQPEVVLEEVDHHCVLLVLCVVTCCGLVRLGRHRSDVGIESASGA